MAEDNTTYVVFNANDQFIKAVLKDGETGAFLNDATSVLATLKDKTGEDVPEFIDVPMVYVALSDGVYRGIVENTFTAPVTTGYFCWLNIIRADGLKASIRKKFKVDTRTK